MCRVLGLALLINGAALRTLAGEFLDSSALTFLSGVITLPAGLAIVLTHNVWAGDWRILITILGWLPVVGGLLRLLAPQRATAVGRPLLATPSTLHISTGAYLGTGALRCCLSYPH